MELSDIISDLEQTKILSLSSFGFITGGIASFIGFDQIVENRKSSIFSDNKKTEKRLSEGMASFVAGITSINYNGSFLGNVGETLTYTVLFRIGYGAGYTLVNNLNYTRL